MGGLFSSRSSDFQIPSDGADYQKNIEFRELENTDYLGNFANAKQAMETLNSKFGTHWKVVNVNAYVPNAPPRYKVKPLSSQEKAVTSAGRRNKKSKLKTKKRRA